MYTQCPYLFYVYLSQCIILSAKQQTLQADTTRWEREIDELVYRLYDLTYEEIKLIDPLFTISKEAYEKVKI